MRNFRKIVAWQKADDLAVSVYEVSKCFPKAEIYGLTSQLRRAAVSVAANIAEGSGRESQRDYLHFLHIARGSLAETDYLIHLAFRLHYLTDQQAEVLNGLLRKSFACLHGLIEAVGREI
jgi:four helix bundle protein